jgi:hypothetical protein
MNSKLSKCICAAALLAALVNAGCSNFNDQWRKAAASRTPARELAGRWQGQWISARNGHTGSLRAVITPKQRNAYHAVFHATYASVFTFTYAVDLEVTKHGARCEFRGTSNLPAWAGGHYETSGHATKTDFTADYRSKFDDGRFEMKRVTD